MDFSARRCSPASSPRVTPADVVRERTSSARRIVTSGRRPPPRPAGRVEQPIVAASEAELAALESTGDGESWRVGGHEVRLTNLGKVIVEADPLRDLPAVTKRDLIRYYCQVAPVLVPYLADRGTTVQRFPNGTKRPGFWQKDLPGHAPDWVRRWTFHHHREGPKTYPVVDRVATLAWLAQEAAVELHPWTSTLERPAEPTYALVDIDPGDATTWQEVLALARLYRAALGHLSVVGVPKVTGKRGIQVWIPVRPGYAFDETRDWVERLSRAVAATVPDLVSWEWSKRERRGLARLDYTQNAGNKTLVAPYAVRPSPGAPVSAPISWDELDDPLLQPDRWSMGTLADRLASVGDLFAPALHRDQELPAL